MAVPSAPLPACPASTVTAGRSPAACIVASGSTPSDRTPIFTPVPVKPKVRTTSALCALSPVVSIRANPKPRRACSPRLAANAGSASSICARTAFIRCAREGLAGTCRGELLNTGYSAGRMKLTAGRAATASKLAAGMRARMALNCAKELTICPPCARIASRTAVLTVAETSTRTNPCPSAKAPLGTVSVSTPGAIPTPCVMSRP